MKKSESDLAKELKDILSKKKEENRALMKLIRNINSIKEKDQMDKNDVENQNNKNP